MYFTVLNKYVETNKINIMEITRSSVLYLYVSNKLAIVLTCAFTIGPTRRRNLKLATPISERKEKLFQRTIGDYDPPSHMFSLT